MDGTDTRAGSGTTVISWSQVELDGLWGASATGLRRGATFAWAGDPVRVGRRADPLLLGEAEDGRDPRRRGARAVARLLGRLGLAAPDLPGHGPAGDWTLTVTDGRRAWTGTFVRVGSGRPPLLAFEGEPPPRHQELWVVSHGVAPDAADPGPGGVICFTPGTLLLTPDGVRPVEALGEGDRLQTLDDGPAEILWRAERRLSGARLHVSPHLAPIRLTEGALDRGVPDSGLLVSPDHRIVLRGARARALFGAEEVLVAARDLVDGRTVLRERGLREVAYVHLLLPRHAVVLANAVATESFHPAGAALASLTEADRERLLRRLPEPAGGPEGYGPFARRVLAGGEAAILMADRAA